MNEGETEMSVDELVRAVQEAHAQHAPALEAAAAEFRSLFASDEEARGYLRADRFFTVLSSLMSGVEPS